MHKPGRNDPCPCGSGKKFKKCCLGKHEAPASEPVDRTSPTRAHPDKPVAFFNEPVAFFDEIDEVSNRALDLIEEGRLEEAEAICQQLLAEFPDMPDGLMRMAALHEARGQPREAAACYRKAADLQLRNDPESGHEFAAGLRAQADQLDAGAPREEAPESTDRL